MKASMSDDIRTIGDWITATITVATLIRILPAHAAITSLIWWALGIVGKVTGEPIHVLVATR
jgi:hypothetical protein